MSRLISFLFVLAIVLLTAPAADAQIYVDKGAPGANDGTSWTDAYTDLQTAIDDASSSSEIWIAQGIYRPDSEGDSFTITGNIDGVRLYGGFDGTESSRSDREPKVHRTILSGDLAGDDTDPDADGIIEDADPDQDGRPENLQGGENAHHVLLLDGGDGIGADVGANVTTATVIDGVVITAGQADGSRPEEEWGGGLFCDGVGDTNECSPTLQNVVFVGNVALEGGALFNLGADDGTSSPRITSAVFAGNAAGGRGGATYNSGRTGGISSPQITNALFTKNASVEGGAIVNTGGGESRPLITNATITGNTATNEGGAIFNEGASPDVRNTILWGNRASFGGDEIQNRISGSVSLSHSIVQGGDEGIGGGTGFSDGSDNLDKNPQFVDAAVPAGPDEVFGTVDDGTNIYNANQGLSARRSIAAASRPKACTISPSEERTFEAS